MDEASKEICLFRRANVACCLRVPPVQPCDLVDLLLGGLLFFLDLPGFVPNVSFGTYPRIGPFCQINCVKVGEQRPLLCAVQSEKGVMR